MAACFVPAPPPSNHLLIEYHRISAQISLWVVSKVSFSFLIASRHQIASYLREKPYPRQYACRSSDGTFTMTSVMRNFVAGATTGVRFDTKISSKTEDSQRGAQARTVTPPTSNPSTMSAGGDLQQTGSTIKAPGGVFGLDLLSAAAENQAVEDIIDESLKVFDLATCTKNLRSYKTV